MNRFHGPLQVCLVAAAAFVALSAGESWDEESLIQSQVQSDIAGDQRQEPLDDDEQSDDPDGETFDAPEDLPENGISVPPVFAGSKRKQNPLQMMVWFKKLASGHYLADDLYAGKYLVNRQLPGEWATFVADLTEDNRGGPDGKTRHVFRLESKRKACDEGWAMMNQSDKDRMTAGKTSGGDDALFAFTPSESVRALNATKSATRQIVHLWGKAPNTTWRACMGWETSLRCNHAWTSFKRPTHASKNEYEMFITVPFVVGVQALTAPACQKAANVTMDTGFDQLNFTVAGATRTEFMKWGSTSIMALVANQSTAVCQGGIALCNTLIGFAAYEAAYKAMDIIIPNAQTVDFYTKLSSKRALFKAMFTNLCMDAAESMATVPQDVAHVLSQRITTAMDKMVEMDSEAVSCFID